MPKRLSAEKQFLLRHTATLPTPFTLHHTWLKPSVLHPHSDHYHPKHGFFHPWPVERSTIDIMQWLLNRQVAKWPRWQTTVCKLPLPFDAMQWLLQKRPAHWPSWDDSPQPPSPLFSQPCTSTELSTWRAWFVGHATVLLQMGRYHFLTDPVWAMRASPLGFTGPKRVRPAGIALADLPKIDAVLLSHNHYDHLDPAALTWLHRRDGMPIYTGLGNAQYLSKHMQVIELDWWQQAEFALDARIKIVYTPAQHNSGRGMFDHNHALWGGFSLLTPDDHLFFAGDTGYAHHFNDIKQRFGAPRLALLPIGAYKPREIMKTMHMNPADAVQAHLDLGATRSLAIHHRTFQLTDEAMNQPLLELADALTARQLPADCFLTPREGVGVTV